MFKLLLVCVALSSTQCGASISGFGSLWMHDLDESIEKMSSDISKSIEKQIKATSKHIDDQFEEISKRNEAMRKRTEASIAKMKTNSAGSPDTDTVSHTFKTGPNVQSSGHSYSSSSSMGSSTSTKTGRNKDGDAYSQETTETRTGNTLYRTVRVHNLKTGTITETKTSLDLSDPKAKPVVEKTVTSK